MKGNYSFQTPSSSFLHLLLRNNIKEFKNVRRENGVHGRNRGKISVVEICKAFFSICFVSECQIPQLPSAMRMVN
jgi:hypothetical protein